MNQEIISKLKEMRMTPFLEECIRQEGLPDMIVLSFEERLYLAVDAEYAHRQNTKEKRLLRAANLWEPTATLKNYKYNSNRNLTLQELAEYSSLNWAKAGKILIIMGPTGTGKTFLLSAFGREGCEHGLRCKYYRTPRLLSELEISRGDGTYEKKLAELIKPDLLLLDDFGLQKFDDRMSLDFLEVLEERVSKKKAMALGTQYPVSSWPDLFEDRTVADAVMDRLVQGAYRIHLGGPSMRKVLSNESALEEPALS